MKVPYINLGIQHQNIMEELRSAFTKVVETGQFILGEELVKFEQSFGSTYVLRHFITSYKHGSAHLRVLVNAPRDSGSLTQVFVRWMQ